MDRRTEMYTVTIDTDRLKAITTLEKGLHGSIAYGVCVMEAVAYVAGEPWSDHPQCACPVLTSYAIGLNDRMPDDQLQRLLPYVVRLVGSRATPAIEQKRSYLLADGAVRVIAPLALEAIGLTENAERLRVLPPIIDAATSQEGRDEARLARKAAAAYPGASSAGGVDTDPDAAAAAASAAAASAYAAADASASAAYAAAAAVFAAASAAAASAYAYAAAYASASAYAYAAAAAGGAKGTRVFPATVWDAAIDLLDRALTIGAVKAAIE